MTRKTRPPSLALRVARLLFGRSRLRRPADRLEGGLVIVLSALFLAAVAAAPFFAEHIYHTERAGAAELRRATAVMTQDGPSGTYLTAPGEAKARWQAPDGQQRTGVLTTATAPGILDASAGTRVQVWLTLSGQPQIPPAPAANSMFASVVFAAAALCGTAIILLMCYWICRQALDRQRMAMWASEWSAGPRWTASR